MAGLIVVPQILVALLSPWVGYYSDRGRNKLCLSASHSKLPGRPCLRSLPIIPCSSLVNCLVELAQRP